MPDPVKPCLRRIFTDRNPQTAVESGRAGKERREDTENTKEKEAKNEKLAPEVQKIIDQGDALSERSTSVMKPFREKRFPQRSAGWRCW